jgi:uncharacterized Tic20 family protein
LAKFRALFFKSKPLAGDSVLMGTSLILAIAKDDDVVAKEVLRGKFWGRAENAVRIQISAAIYCLVAIVQHDMRLEHSTYEVLQILSISLTDKNLFMFYIFFLIILKIFMVSSGFLALK